MKNRNTILITVLLVLGLFAVRPAPKAFGVSPAPDGGYPRGNTAEGQTALLSLTTGGFNTAVGYLSLRSNTDGSYNTAVGAGALLANTGEDNTATGAGALLSNSNGGGNTANGGFALFSNTTGHSDTATGDRALFSNTTGNSNTGNGLNALQANTTGNQNTAAGAGALFSNTAGGQNTAVGDDALSNNTTGGGNIALGSGAGGNVTSASNVICIGADGNNVSNACYIGQIFSSTVSASAVFVNSDGRLGTMTSSERFKDEIKPMDRASEAILVLRPVSFRYKKEIDPQGIRQFGLVAEEVERVNPDLVIRDPEGKPQTVRYEQVNAMLLNEFLKEHRKVQELEANAAEQQKEVNLLRSELKEQAALIRKVSAEVELRKPAPQTVAKD